MPEDQWVQNYKSTDPVNALHDDAQEVEKVVSDNEDEQQNLNILDRINNESQKQVTACEGQRSAEKSEQDLWRVLDFSRRHGVVPKTKEKFDLFT